MKTRKYSPVVVQSTGIIAIIVSLALFFRCAIEESTGPETGAILISAADTMGNELIGGKIFLNNIERGEITPDTLFGISLGEYSVKVEYSGYETQEDSVKVYHNQLTETRFIMPPALFGSLTVESTPPGAMVIIDREYEGYITPAEISQLEVGLHAVSVFIEGWFTLEPAIDTVEIVWQGNSSSNILSLMEGTRGHQIGDVAPDFTLIDDFADSVSLHNYRGSVVLLTFFFKDCPNCMEEFPEIEELYQDFAAVGLMVLGIDPILPPFYNDDLEDIKAVRDEFNLSFNLLIDDGGTVNFNLYGVVAHPTNILIKPSGVIHNILGHTDYETLASEIEEILGG